MTRSYAPTQNAGDSRHRIWKIVGENPRNAVPYLVSHEEVVVLTSAQQEEKVDGPKRKLITMYDPTGEVTIRSHLTDEAGAFGNIPATITMEEAYAVLYSLGRRAQLLADAEEVAAAEQV